MSEHTDEVGAALRELAAWLVSLDDPDGPGAQDRRTVTLNQIIDRARQALGPSHRAGGIAPLDLTSCSGCGFSSGGISAGCGDCAARHPQRYAEWAQRLVDERDAANREGQELRWALGRAQRRPAGGGAA